MGLYRAGFDVVGVDIKPQPRYPAFHDADYARHFRFVQADALRPPLDLRGFDFIWASPPCQHYTKAQNASKNAHAHPDSVPPTREMLRESGVPHAIENVVGAPLENPVVLCGLAFGLKVKRHRLIESNLLLLAPPCPSHNQDYYVIFGQECRNRRKGDKAGRKNKIAVGREAMGIPWMTRAELSEAIPPAYSEFVGRQALAAIDCSDGVMS